MGPLTGVKVVELAGLGPGPFCGMLLSDLGADVVLVDRRDWANRPTRAVTSIVTARGRRSIGVDLKHPDGVECVLRLAAQADVLIDPFRPGVAERLGVGPDECMGRNERLVYARMTGWGQTGPLASTAGHDIDYISIAGALAHFGRAGAAPTPPLNLVGDFGGGALYLALGIVCGLLEARTSGRGQVVDTAMVDGAASLMAMTWGYLETGNWEETRGVNILDTGAPFYDVYETADGEYMAVGAIEPEFYAELLEQLGLGHEDLPAQMDRDGWPTVRRRFTETFATRTRDEWCTVFEGSDACVAPVLRMTEAFVHPQMAARETLVRAFGMRQPAPAPRFSRTPGEIQGPSPRYAAHTDEVLRDWGFDPSEVERLHDVGAIASAGD